MPKHAFSILLLGAVACAAGPHQPGPAAPEPADPSTPVASPAAPTASAAAGHPSGHFPGSSWKVHDSGVDVPDEWRACSASADCALVVVTCCDQCNGGKAVAVNAKHAKDAEAKYPKSCGGVACTERGCFTRATCQESRCVMEWESAS